jgi:sugar phosphate isomerase/epimerase
MFNVSINISPDKSVFGPVLFSGDLDEGLKNAKDLGYDSVELSLLNSKNMNQVWLLNKLKELGLYVCTIATGQTYYTDGYYLYSVEEDKREKALERIRAHIDLASKLGSAVIIGGIRGNVSDDFEERFKQMDRGIFALNVCVKYAQKKKITLLLEPINRYETNIINTLEEGIKLIEEIGSQSLKLLADTFHMNIEEKSIEESLFKAKPYIEYIHFADSNRLAPGWGHINFRGIISTLVKINYKGTIGVEILPKPNDYKAALKAINYIKGLEKKVV